MMDNRILDINISDGKDRLDELADAIDGASNRDQRTVVTAGGKIIAAIVTADDLARLEALDAAVNGGLVPEYVQSILREHAPQPPAAVMFGRSDQDVLTRIAAVFGALIRAGGPLAEAITIAMPRDFPQRPGILEQRIERWLRNG